MSGKLSKHEIMFYKKLLHKLNCLDCSYKFARIFQWSIILFDVRFAHIKWYFHATIKDI